MPPRGFDAGKPKTYTGWRGVGMEVPTPRTMRRSMSAYERLKEESRDRKTAHQRRKTVRRQLTAFQRKQEDAKRPKHRAWQYYKAAAIARKLATQKEEKCLDDDSGSTRC